MGDGFDSRFFEVARSRNMAVQRQLNTRLGSISKEREYTRDRIMTEQRMLRLQLRDMKPQPPESAGHSRPGTVLPRGLTAEQREALLAIKEERPRSISLGEFEDKLSEWKRHRETERFKVLSDRTRQQTRQKKNFTKIDIDDIDSDSEDDTLYVSPSATGRSKTPKIRKQKKTRRHRFVRPCCVSQAMRGISRSSTTIF